MNPNVPGRSDLGEGLLRTEIARPRQVLARDNVEGCYSVDGGGRCPNTVL